ncbi:MAG: hypothetical protein IIA14_12825, partial [SAR324 cluster bacterium]|nr:hypothetical protein [SAR324 cluster bacterium]
MKFWRTNLSGLLIFGMFLFLAGCAEERGTSEVSAVSAFGGIRVEIVFPDAKGVRALSAIMVPHRGLQGAETMRAMVSAPDMATLQQDYDFALGQGEIQNVPAGENRTLVLQVLNSGDAIISEGITTGITVIAGLVSDSG